LTDVIVPLERALILMEPIDGERLNAAPALRWAGFAGAARYHVLVMDAGTTEVLVDEMTADTQLQVTASLTPGQTYQWVVNAVAGDDALLASGNRLFTMSD
jgi:hypothetical protein